ncbi:hypothetical protein Tco_0862088 [Tanacetum coccineum]
MYLKHHEKQVEDILNYLDELYLHRIERMEEGRINGNELKTELKEIPVEAQTAVLACVVIPTILTGTTAVKREILSVYQLLTFCFNGKEVHESLIYWFERTESVFSQSRCAEENKVTFATGTLTDDALSWWNAHAQPMGIEQANQITWTELKRLLTNKYCPRTEIKKNGSVFYGLTVNGSDLKIKLEYPRISILMSKHGAKF